MKNLEMKLDKKTRRLQRANIIFSLINDPESIYNITYCIL